MLNPKALLLLCSFLFIFSSALQAQSVQRQSIGTIGTSSFVDGTYYGECLGQPWQTLSSDANISPGYIQPQTRYVSLDQTELKLKAYPIPVTTVINLEWENAEGSTIIKVYNMQGQIVSQHEEHSKQAQLSFEQLPSGTYIIHVQQEQTIKRITIIKQ